MARKRTTTKIAVKRSRKRSIPAVDLFTPNVSDEALERAGLTNFGDTKVYGPATMFGTCMCVLVAVDNLRMLIPLTPNKKAVTVVQNKVNPEKRILAAARAMRPR
jgi:hypothetical protein